MTKTTKFWISDKLELRWNEWPEKPLLSAAHILDYCHDEANAKRLGIGLGQIISTRILEILRAYK